MTTAIYYEQEVVSLEDAQRARALAGDFVEEAAPADTAWADSIPGPQPQREANFRSMRYLDVLMPWLVRLGQALEETAPDVAFRHGSSLAEVAKFELLFDVALADQRWQALSNIRRRSKPDRLLWLTSKRWPDGELAALARAAAPMRLEVHRASPAGVPFWKPRWKAFKSAISGPMERAGRFASAALRLPRWPRDAAEIVFTEYFPNSVAASFPIAEKLQTEHGVRPVWLAARRKVADALAARGVRSLQLLKLLSARAYLRGRLSARQRRALAAALRGLPEELNSGTGDPGGREYFLAVLEHRVARAWNNAAFWIEAYEEAFAALRPAVVISTTYSSAVGRAAALTARRLGGHAVYLQHGLFPDYEVWVSFCNDLLLLWGRRNSQTMTRFGVDPAQIRTTGATLYDRLARRGAAGRGSGTFPAPGEPLRVAYMASRTGGMMVSYQMAKTCLLAVAEAVRRTPGARLTVKTHPGDHTGLVPQMLAAYPEFTIVERGDSQEVILDSDLLIVASSTTGLEACAAGKPLLVLDVIDDANAVPYVEYGAAVRVGLGGVDLAAELTQAIASLQHSPHQIASLAEGRRRLLDDMLNGCAGDATDRAAAAVLELLERPACVASSPSIMAPNS